MRIDFSFEFDQKNKVKKATDKGLIQLRAYCAGKRKYFTTKISVYQTEWNEQKQRIVRHSDADHLNNILDTMISKVSTAQTKALVNNEYFGLDTVKTIIDTQKIKTGYFIEFVNNELKTNNKFSSNTKRSKKSIIKKLLEFTKSKDILFSDLNYILFSDFVNFLYDKGLAQNSVRKHIVACKAMINEAKKKGYYEKENPCNKIKIKEQETVINALTWEQLQTIEALTFEKYETRLETIRDMFLFSCFTGLRISDLIKIKKENLKQTSEGLTLNFTAQKTSKIHVLPIYQMFPLPQENTTRPIKLINKYLSEDKELIFKKYSDQLYNRELKEIGHRAKIDFKLTSHIGRKTLATLLPSFGVSSFVLKDILKHSNIKTTEGYVKTDEKRVALDLKNTNWR